MPTVGDVLGALEAIAPARYAFSFDKVGLQIGSRAASVSKVLVVLDCSQAAADRAVDVGAELVIAHHPLIWEPLKSINTGGGQGKIIETLVANGVSFAAAHTNWDSAPGGINDVMADLIGLQDVEVFGSDSQAQLYKVAVMVPVDGAGGLIDAMSEAGAGHIGNYDRCAFSVDGIGTFRGQEGANPAIGSVGSIEEVAESKVEMVVPEADLNKVVSALRSAHPYEEPAYDLIPLKNSGGHPAGRVGNLGDSMTPAEFQDHLDTCLGTRCMVWSNRSQVSRVAVVGGAATGEWRAARAAGADAFVTGEVPHHVSIEAQTSGLTIAAAGHFATENPGALELGVRLGGLVEDVEFLPFTPEAGIGGRPN